MHSSSRARDALLASGNGSIGESGCSGDVASSASMRNPRQPTFLQECVDHDAAVGRLLGEWWPQLLTIAVSNDLDFCEMAIHGPLSLREMGAKRVALIAICKSPVMSI
jgi:hypothetical protein